MDSRGGALEDVLALLKRNRWLIALCAVAAVAVALVHATSQPTKYSASGQLSFQDNTEALDLLGTATAPDLQPEKSIAARSERITSNDVLAAAGRDARDRRSIDALRSAVHVEVLPVSNLVEVSATAPSSAGAAALANSVIRETQRILTTEERTQLSRAARSLSRRLRGLKRSDATKALYADRISRLVALSELTRPVTIQKLASAPRWPVSPKPVRDAIFALILGILAGLGVAYARERLNRRLRDSQQAHEQLGLPVLALIRETALGHAGTLTAGREPMEEQDIESFRILRQNIQVLDIASPPKSVLVTSAGPEEGKSSVAASYAYASALSGRRTLLVDCDLRRPTLHERFGVPRSPGIADHLVRGTPPQELLHVFPLAGTDNGSVAVQASVPLVVVTAGCSVDKPAELINSPGFGAFLEEVKEAYDLVVLDTPPLLLVADTRELASHVDSILVCARMGRTSIEQAAAMRELLERLPPRTTGAVVTGAKKEREGAYGYYGYAYSQT